MTCRRILYHLFISEHLISISTKVLFSLFYILPDSVVDFVVWAPVVVVSVLTEDTPSEVLSILTQFVLVVS